MPTSVFGKTNWFGQSLDLSDRSGSPDIELADDEYIYENEENLKKVQHRRENIPVESLSLIRIIGEGLFGRVYIGKNCVSKFYL